MSQVASTGVGKLHWLIRPILGQGRLQDFIKLANKLSRAPMGGYSYVSRHYVFCNFRNAIG